MRRSISYIGAAIIVSLIFGTIYGTTQQAQRHDANYPQIQMAEDAAAALNHGAEAAALASGKVRLESSLAPFTIGYDKFGHVIAGSGYLNGAIPVAPKSVLASANGKPYSSVTWQPQSGVRIAAISVAAD